MEKFLSILLALTLVFALVACEKTNDTSSELETDANAKTESNDTTSTETEESENTETLETESTNNMFSSETQSTPQDSSKPTESSKPAQSSEPIVDKNSGEIKSSKPTETSKPTTSSNPNSSTNTPSTSKPSTHTHSFSDATCTEPKKCSCGATEGSAQGHKWKDATCKTPKTCSACKITKGDVGEHILENGLCKFCKETIVVSPRNLDVTKTYIHISEVDDFELENVFYRNVISVDTIGFSQYLHIGNQGIFSPNKYDWTILDKKVIYNDKEYYHIGIGGVGIGITYQLTQEEIIIRDGYEPNEYATLNLLSDGSIKVVSKTDNFKGNWEIQIGWIYKPTTQTFF